MKKRRQALWKAALAGLFLLTAAATAAEDGGGSAAVRGPSSSGGLPGLARYTLDDVVRIAIANHPQVGRADADARAAAARKGQAESAYYPAATLSAGGFRSRAFFAQAERATTTDSKFLEGTVLQLLSDFGRTKAGVSRAEALAAAARAQGGDVRRNVAFFAKVAFFDVLRARTIAAARRETVRQRESLLRQASAFYEAGIRARIDVVRAEASLYQAQAELLAAENDLFVARIALLNQMGVDGPPDFELVEEPAPASPPGALEDWLREAQEKRPDLSAARERARAARNAVRAARAGYAPLLTAAGSYGFAASDFPLERAYSLSLQMSVPLFSGFSTREQIAEALAEEAAAALAVVDLARQVRLEVEKAALRVREAAARIEARKKEHAASAENLRLAAARYEAGAGDIIEMIDAQAQMARSDTDTADARFDHAVAVAELLRAVGR